MLSRVAVMHIACSASSPVFPHVRVDVALDVAYWGDGYLGCEEAKEVSEGKRTMIAL